MRRWIFALSLCLGAVACGNGGGSNNGDGTNNGSSNNGGANNGAAGECQTDEDCPGASEATFLNDDNVVCTASEVRGRYCTECVNDAQCPAGHACQNATNCYELPPCSVGADCSDAPGEVHQACVNGFCSNCDDDVDCEADEVCYSLRCATRSTVDPSCIDATCEGPCEITYDGDGTPTGVACMN